jgi:dihydropteroate synthase
MKSEKLRLKRMGVMNITPNSFSDGGELDSVPKIREKFKQFGMIHALDIGAESTAPKNDSISWLEEWSRWQFVLPLLNEFKSPISADTYHPETIFELVKIWKDKKIPYELFWNDVSGKFDDFVRDFLKEGARFHYIFCHNRAPSRALSGKHMDYVMKDEGHLEEELEDFFRPHINLKVIFDPCLGFSKTYDENWYILQHFSKFQHIIKHERWLLGFSRKSFLRKKYQTEDREELDKLHQKILKELIPSFKGELWIRTHRPDLLDL